MNTLLQIDNLKVRFFTKDGIVQAVDGISYDLRPGEMLGVVGESGCGKSVTALSVMRLLMEPVGEIAGGKILFRGKDLAPLKESTMRSWRGHKMAMIFQDPMTSLNPVLTVGYQLEETLKIHSKATKAERHKRMIEVLQLVGIPDPERRLSHYPHQMSGGMRQRVMIAMGLACNPELLIADEPTTALDVTIQAQILELLGELQEKLHMGVILISHDLGVVSEMAQRIVVMYAGKIVEKGKTEALFENPLHPYTVGLLESMPKLREPHEKRQNLATIPGMVPSPFAMPRGCRFHPRCPFATPRCTSEEPPFFKLSPEHEVACWLYERSRKTNFSGAFRSPETSQNSFPEKSGEILLEVKHIKKYFPLNSSWRKPCLLKAVEDVSFSLERGETLGLVGESGCGKTTTAKMIAGLEKPTEGSIFFEGRDLGKLDKGERRQLSRKIQMIFQDSYSSLNPRMTAREIVAEGLEIHRIGTSAEREQAVRQALEDAGLGPEFLNRYAHQFSGGQRQRLGIARALVMKPELIICDEPVSALDVSIQAQVINLLQELQQKKGFSYLFVAHDLSVVRHISDRVAVMYLGHMMEMAATDKLFENWQHPYTEALLSAVPEVGCEKKGRILLEGDVPSPMEAPPGCPFANRCHRKEGERCFLEKPPLREIGKDHFVACWRQIG